MPKLPVEEKPREILLKGALLLSLGGAAAGILGCGDNEEAPKNAAPFEVTRKWRLPPRAVLQPPTMPGAEPCFKNFWDEDNPRSPVSTNPLILRIDGRCNSPLTSPTVGMYAEPDQNSPSVATTHNGDAVGVECATDGQEIWDIRQAPEATSTTWLGVVWGGETGTEPLEEGYIPSVNLGFPKYPGTAGMLILPL